MHEILPPQGISSAIISLIKGTKRRVYLVSPYVSLWPLLERSVEQAMAQGKRITFIVRSEPANLPGFERLHKQFGCEVIAIEHLHTKLYINETQAIVGSMNLYDYSQRHNHELALLIKTQNTVRELRKKILQEDLLTLAPRYHWRDRFYSEETTTADRMLALEAGFTEKGFCVACGTRVALDNRRPQNPIYVRCAPCWSLVPDVGPDRFPVAYCHYCGAHHSSVLSKPFHAHCQAVLVDYASWRETAVVTPR